MPDNFMMSQQQIGFHEQATVNLSGTVPTTHPDTEFTFTFENFFHPFVGELLSKLNAESLSGVLDPKWQESLKQEFFKALYQPATGDQNNPVQVESFPKEIEVDTHGPYANYNWELFFHIPLTIAVHLSKSQRFAEAQRWFHYIFNPTSNDKDPDPRRRVWKFLAFRQANNSRSIENIIRLLSTPREQLSDKTEFDSILEDYHAILSKPFQPHVVARTRPIAYQYYVVMKYLDNLIAWGDHLFQQDTVESINEATMRYVLAANLLGPRPQRIPPQGTVRPKTFAQLKQEGLGEIGNALVNLEGQFPFNLAPRTSSGSGNSSGPLFGVGRSLYFCLPRNEKLLSYWDIVADRLFKVRHCMNIAGVIRPLALFDPPLDPGMLIKAAAAGIDVSKIAAGLNQPIGPVRSVALIQKALELCSEVRSLGGALLSALEKGDSEHLALMRQSHEIKIEEIQQDVRFLQWKSAEESTKSLLTSRATALERFHYYQRLLGLPGDQNTPDTIDLDHRELTEENFDEAYDRLVGQYDQALTLQKLPRLDLATGVSSPLLGSGYSGSGRVYLSRNEDKELNAHLPAARDARLVASAANVIASALTPIPSINIKAAFWGLGAGSEITRGEKIAAISKFVGEIAQITATWEQDQAGMASRYASYERRADEWLLQYNLAAHELKQNGRQILTSLIAEQIARHEYLNLQQQISNSREVEQYLHTKFTNEELYLWMQGEISRLYYEYYRFGFETARKAERTMKQELMRPELDNKEFIGLNYWDGGRRGLLAGEALHLDVKQMEMAYHEANKRELELTRHVSLRQLDPLALLKLKAGGSCEVTIPEWLYDRDCPGHYMRRIKSVGVSLPSVVGPYTSLNCTLSLIRSSVRTSPLPKDRKYERQGEDDDRFIDYIGTSQSIVTSSGSNDSGLFDTNLRDERFLPFEGAGAESTWKIDLPAVHRAFDYATISDVILHVRYTARDGVELALVNKALDDLFNNLSQSNLALLFSLRHDFPTEWAAFVNGTDNFKVTIRKSFFPYFAQGKMITIHEMILCGPGGDSHYEVQSATKGDLNHHVTDEQFLLSVQPDSNDQVLKRKSDAQVFLMIRYTL